MSKFKELMESIDILISKRMENTTKIYYCIIKTINDKTCEVTIMGNTYVLPFYGNTPILNRKYPVFVPQGNFSQAFIVG